MPTLEVLGSTPGGGQGGQILWDSFSGIYFHNPGGTTLPHYIKHSGVCSPPALIICVVRDRGRNGSRGFWQGRPEDGGICLCQRWPYCVHKVGGDKMVILHPYGAI